MESSEATNQAAARRRVNFAVSGDTWRVNGKLFDPACIDTRPRLDSTEVSELTNDGDHPVHLHLVPFRVLSRGGKTPGPYDAGWKDTVYLQAQTVRVVTRFADHRSKDVFHCHNLEHEDMMMMANFEVV